MKYGIMEMARIILDDYTNWYQEGMRTGKFRQEGIIFMRGVAGCGKTEIIYQIAERLAAGGYSGLDPIVHAAPPVQLFFNAAMDPESIAGTPAPGRVRLELEESEVRTAGSVAEEDLFRISGVPTNQLDVPAFVRRRRSS